LLFIDSLYTDSADSSARFRWVKAPTNSELYQFTHAIAHRLAWYIERQGLLEWNDRYAIPGGDRRGLGLLR